METWRRGARSRGGAGEGPLPGGPRRRPSSSHSGLPLASSPAPEAAPPDSERPARLRPAPPVPVLPVPSLPPRTPLRLRSPPPPLVSWLPCCRLSCRLHVLVTQWSLQRGPLLLTPPSTLAPASPCSTLRTSPPCKPTPLLLPFPLILSEAIFSQDLPPLPRSPPQMSAKNPLGPPACASCPRRRGPVCQSLSNPPKSLPSSPFASWRN